MQSTQDMKCFKYGIPLRIKNEMNDKSFFIVGGLQLIENIYGVYKLELTVFF